MLPISYFATDPEENLNWVFRPFEVEVAWASPDTVFLACMVGYPLVLYLPSHLALAAWARRKEKMVGFGSQ